MSDIYANHQTLFDHVVGSLIKQGKPSLVELWMNGRRDFSCAYRGDGGTRCAAGWALPDAAYRQGIEGTEIDSVIRFGGEATAVLRPYRAMLTALQEAHDNSWDPRSWDAGDHSTWLANFKRRARDICAEFRLVWRHD